MNDELGERLRLIRERLDALRRVDARFEVFGASYHKYLLRPPVEQQVLVAFEEMHQVRLPED